MDRSLAIEIMHLIQEFRTISKHFRFSKIRGYIAKLSKKGPSPIDTILGSLKINKLKAMENQKMLEFGVFRQPQQLHAILNFPEKKAGHFLTLPLPFHNRISVFFCCFALK